jgi:hypothetical protein
MAFLPFLTAALPVISNIFGGASKGAQEGRNTQASQQAQQDLIRSSQYNTAQNAQMQQGNLDLNRQQFSEAARGNRGREAMIGEVLANWKPGSVSVPGIQNATISGGLQNLPEGAKAAAAEMAKQAMAKMLTGDTFQGGQILPQPGVTPLPQPGKFDKFLDIAGFASALGGGLLPLTDLLKERKYQPTGGSADGGSTDYS